MEDYDIWHEFSLMSNGSNASYYDYYFFYEESVLETFLKWFEALCVMPIGVIGNILVLCVLLRKKYRKSSTAVFFSFLAISDIIILITGIYILFTVRMSDKIECKIFTSIWLSSGQLSSCILATIATERAFSVLFPHRAKFVFTARNAKLIMATVTSGVFGLNAALIVSYDVGGDKLFEEMYCPSDDLLLSSIVHVYPWVDFSLGFAIPFMVILVCSVIIILKLRPAIFAQKKEDRKVSSVTKTLLSTNACFLITLAPSRIYNIIYPIPLEDEEGFHTFVAFSTLSQVNAAANFFLYFLNAPVFRADVRQLYCSKPKAKGGSKVTKSTSQCGNIISNE
ncbi:kappa-type opioid receptor-like [Mercenaria mercenaria]|uniref:kappa-type opioid receptor-like n=1 Tax=Mercenaria mercenaria TaxID=6596 RepID=UPI00234FA557|nr:kappa-type opioid receptor-like [Mercenaria mercenaria]